MEYHDNNYIIIAKGFVIYIVQLYNDLVYTLIITSLRVLPIYNYGVLQVHK